MSLRPISDSQELAHLVEGFEQQRLSHLEWDHRAHLAVAAAYVWRHYGEAFPRFKERLLRLNASHGVETTPTRGYHETITIAWLRLIDGRRTALPEGTTEVDFANDVLAACADKQVLLKHYSRDRIMSLEAWYGWLEPDLEPLPAR